MSRLRFIAVAALGALLAAAPPAGAQVVEKPEDVVRVEKAVTELAVAKRAAAARWRRASGPARRRS